MKIFEYGTIVIPKNSWKLFEGLLFKTALIDPSILDILTRILITYRSYLDVDCKAKLKDLICSTITEHSPINHNFEISWALWIAKTFEIEIDEISANKIIDTKDSIAILILLDLINTTPLVLGHPKINKLQVELKDDILFTESWLLAYEGVKKGWLVPANPNLLDDNLFFKILKDLDVEFYEMTNQLISYQIKSDNKQDEPRQITYEGVNNDTMNSDVSASVTAETAIDNLLVLIDNIPSGFNL